MPYAANSELPKAVRDAYSSNCQSVFRHTWNSEYADHGDESRAFATAHAAAKRCQGGTKSMALPMKTFQLFAPKLIASRSTDGKLRIEGVASSTIKDRHGDQLTLKALRKMEASAVGMTIFMNHEYRVPQDVFGTVEKTMLVKTDAKDDKTGEPIYDLRFGIRVADSNEEALKTFTLIEDDKVKLGLSIGAMVPEGGASFNTKTASYIVDDVDLVETSVIGIPASPRAWVDYVVKAFSGRFPDRLSDERRAQLVKELAGEEPPEDEEEETEDEEATEETEELVEKTAEADGIAKEYLELPESATGFLTQGIDIGDLLVEAIDDEIGEDHFDTGGMELLTKESWSSAYVNALPNSAFACPGSRKYPHHSKGGAVDMAHLKAALSRVGDESNDQCGKAHLEAHARKLGLGDREKWVWPELTKDGSGQHPHAHIHEHEHEHGYENTKTIHNHEHAHLHSHEHEDDHEHASDQADFQHDHSHSGSYEEEHAHEGTAEEKTEKDLEPDITKSTVTVWESDGDVVEVNTGRSKPKSEAGQSEQTEKSETSGGGSDSKVKSAEPEEGSALVVATQALEGSSSTIKALHGQLMAARTEIIDLRKERDAVAVVAKRAIEGVGQLIAQLGEMPMGRKTQFNEVQKSYEDLSAIYDEEVRSLMTKKG